MGDTVVEGACRQPFPDRRAFSFSSTDPMERPQPLVKRRRPIGRRLALAAALVPLTCAADRDLEHRLADLEQQVQALTLRLQVLEQRSAATPEALPAAISLPAEGIVWTFDDFVSASPLKVTPKAFDKKTGRIDLLLQITAVMPDPGAWSGAGRPVPLALTLRGAGGADARAVFTLVRSSSLEPGAHVHLQAQVDPVQAAAAHQIVIAREVSGVSSPAAK